ncbi:putative aldouronate transport system permease protein [Butyrivibrio fibrisolvens]|uniref:Putative aldouronate transport system permease protein n=1 Tax=Butyrivibrio fibrisolvens TaxID=831 RepID=A0A1H9V8Z9_BUTFI|nr:carbohydrate ABC transporter permease [Butyrivibrio fibrisolvens]SES18320.1 putative aldouronate transport system permease protein [Butyrivibrio fibrisolvens]
MKQKIKRLSAFQIADITLVTILSVLILAPVLNIFSSSFASTRALAEGNFIFFPKEVTLDNYSAVFHDSTIWHAYFISVSKTILGVITHVFFCSMVAFGLSKRDLQFRNVYTVMGVITLFFSGGMIPTYLLMKKLGLLNNFLVYILPQLFSYYDVVILMNFFRQIPGSLEESASIDGAGVWRVFLQIAMPLSKPALATIALFNGVYQWNDFMTAKLYMTDTTLYPVQMKLYEIIVQQQAASMNTIGNVALQTTSKGIQLATIVVTTVPILIIYPLLQKHFVSGMMLGAVKE